MSIRQCPTLMPFPGPHKPRISIKPTKITRPSRPTLSLCSKNNEILRRDTTVVKPENQVITMTHTYSTGNGIYGNWNNYKSYDN